MNAARLLEIDVASGKRKVITEDPQFDVNGTINNPKTNALEAVSYTRQRTEYEFIDPKLKTDFEVLQKVRKGDIDSISQDLEDDKWIVGFMVDARGIHSVFLMFAGVSVVGAFAATCMVETSDRSLEEIAT